MYLLASPNPYIELWTAIRWYGEQTHWLIVTSLSCSHLVYSKYETYNWCQKGKWAADDMIWVVDRGNILRQNEKFSSQKNKTWTQHHVRLLIVLTGRTTLQNKIHIYTHTHLEVDRISTRQSYSNFVFFWKFIFYLGMTPKKIWSGHIIRRRVGPRRKQNGDVCALHHQSLGPGVIMLGRRDTQVTVWRYDTGVWFCPKTWAPDLQTAILIHSGPVMTCPWHGLFSKIGYPMGPHNLRVHHHFHHNYFRVIPALTHYSGIVSDITPGSIYGIYIF